MKIHNNFISNSSSQSFIVLAKDSTSTVRQVALMMIDQIIENAYYDEDDEGKEFLADLERWKSNLFNVDENQSIFFPSCNYDTWIVKVEDNIIISTCNNERFEIPNRCRLSERAENTLTEMGINDKDIDTLKYDIYDFYGLYRLFDNFYSLEHNLIGSEISSECPKHKWTSQWKTVEGEIVCPECEKEKWIRKQKLLQINKLSE